MELDNCPADQPASSQFTATLPGEGASSVVEISRRTMADLPGSEVEDLDSFNLIEPPPLDWKSDSSSEAGSADDLDEPSFPPAADGLEEAGPGGSVPPLEVSAAAASPAVNRQELADDNTEPIQDVEEGDVGVEEQEGVRVEERLAEEEEAEVGDEEEEEEEVTFEEAENSVTEGAAEVMSRRPGDEDHTRIHALLNQLQLMGEEPHPDRRSPPRVAWRPYRSPPEPQSSAPSLITDVSDLESSLATETTGLLFSESHQRDLLGLLECTEIAAPPPQAAYLPHRGEVDAVVSVSYDPDDAHRFWGHYGNGQQLRPRDGSFTSLSEDEYPEPVWMKLGEEPPEEEAAAESEQSADDHPAYKDVPGPCDPEDLLDGVIFGAKYLGSTQIKSERNPSTNARMAQAQEAVDRIKAPDGESQPMTEVDLFISTQRIKVLSADTQEAMMDHSLQMISYIADIGTIVVLMARRKPTNRKGQDSDSPTNSSSLSSSSSSSSSSAGPQKKCCMICHVFSSEDAQIIAQAIGQAFGVAYQQFLQANGIKPSQLRPGDYSDFLGTQELYNGDLVHFSDSQNIRDVSRETFNTDNRHLQGCRRDPRPGGGRVGLGLHPAHGGRGQPAARRPGRALRPAQHRRPHHVRQRHQPGGPAHRHLPEHHPGAEKPNQCEAQHRPLPSCYHGDYQETRSQVSAGFQRGGRHHLQPDAGGHSGAGGHPGRTPHHRDQRAERRRHAARQDHPHPVQRRRGDSLEDHASLNISAPNRTGAAGVSLRSADRALPASIGTKMLYSIEAT